MHDSLHQEPVADKRHVAGQVLHAHSHLLPFLHSIVEHSTLHWYTAQRRGARGQEAAELLYFCTAHLAHMRSSMAGWVAGQSEVQAEILHQAAVHGELGQPLRPLLCTERPGHHIRIP